MDGDAAGDKAAEELESLYNGMMRVLQLPGEDGPEEWIWQVFRAKPEVYASQFGLQKNDFLQLLRDKEQMYNHCAGSTQEIAKYRLASFCDEIGRQNQHYKDAIAEVARDVGCEEAEVGGPDMSRFKWDLEEAITRWRGA